MPATRSTSCALKLTLATTVAVVMLLFLPRLAAAWQLRVTPSVVHRGGTITIHKSNSRRCALLLHIGRQRLHDHFRRRDRYIIGTSAPLGKAHVRVTCARTVATVSFVIKAKRRTGPTAPPSAPGAPSAPSGPSAPPDPWTVTSYPASDSTAGIVPGTEHCLDGAVWRDAPEVSSPTGTWLYVKDVLYARPTNGTAGWHIDSYGDDYYNGTAKPPIFDWFDLRTGQVGNQSGLESWNVSGGWTVAEVQFIWDQGVWYRSDEAACSF